MAGIQIGGIASGFDTTSMVEKLMEAERTKVTQIENKKKMTEYKQEAYNSINTLFSDFIMSMRKNFGVSNYIGSSGATRPSAANNLNWLNKASSSNTNSVKATSTSEAKEGTHEITVQQLADSAKFASSSKVDLDGSKTLKEQFGVDNFEITITTGKGDVTIKDTDGTMTFNDLVKEINQVDGVTASYDASIGRFFLQTTETGADQSIQISGPQGEALLNRLNLNMQAGETYTGQNAIIDYNGATGIEFGSNQFRLQGIEIELKNASPSEKITITVEPDIDTIVEKVETFVNEYNTLIEKIGDILVEEKYKDYAPLTDDQKKEMTDKQIEQWEAKVKSGLLRSDTTIQKIQNSLREAFMSPITLSDGSSISLSDFGIESKGYFEGGSKGQLKLNTDKFREAIKGNAEQFTKAFFGTPTDTSLQVLDKGLSSTQLTQKRQESGIFNRLSDILVSGMQEIISKAGTGDNSNTYRQVSSNILLDYVKGGSKSILGTVLTDYNKRISNMNTKLAKLETRYWNQFSAMEKAISQMQTQQSALGYLTI